MSRPAPSIIGIAVGSAEIQKLSTELAGVWKGRRPAFWSDIDVRIFLASMHREVTIEECRRLCAERFGPDRTPSKSALQRFWGALDRVRQTGSRK
jgi:hypothetical protein